MNCDDCSDRLNAYVDRELTERDLQEVQRHLDECQPCLQVFELQAGLKRLVRKECCQDEAPERLRAWVRRLPTEERRA
jgi:mycothiol system anti-sigma-R factor